MTWGALVPSHLRLSGRVTGRTRGHWGSRALRVCLSLCEIGCVRIERCVSCQRDRSPLGVVVGFVIH